MIFGFYWTEWCNRNYFFCSTHTLKQPVLVKKMWQFPYFLISVFYWWKGSNSNFSSFSGFETHVNSVVEQYEPFFFTWMWSCHNLYFQDECPGLCGTPRCMCSLTRAQRFMSLDHFSSQISLTWSEQGIEVMSPFILWYSHLTLYLFFFKKKSSN